MDARVIISPETIKKAGKISNRRKGELRFKKLVEVANTGVLQQAKTNIEVGKLIGITDPKTAYAFVQYQIEQGNLIRRLSGRNPKTGRPEYEFSFNFEKPKKVDQPKVVEPQKQPTQTDSPRQYHLQQKIEPIVLTITKGDIKISIENLANDKAIEFAKSILKGE